MKHGITIIAGIVLVVFGMLTVFMGSSVLLDLFGIREKEGNYVPFVVWANVICGFLYLIAANGLFRKKIWAVHLLFIATGILLLTFAGLYIHIRTGGIYELKTVYAMTFRTVITLVLAVVSMKLMNKKT